jgi:hypothetical protein
VGRRSHFQIIGGIMWREILIIVWWIRRMDSCSCTGIGTFASPTDILLFTDRSWVSSIKSGFYSLNLHMLMRPLVYLFINFKQALSFYLIVGAKMTQASLVPLFLPSSSRSRSMVCLMGQLMSLLSCLILFITRLLAWSLCNVRWRGNKKGRSWLSRDWGQSLTFLFLTYRGE